MANDAMWVIYDARSREQGARPGTAAATRVYCERAGAQGVTGLERVGGQCAGRCNNYHNI